MNQHILGLYTVIYHVQDLAQAKQWYQSLLGHAPYFDQPFYVGFNVAGHELGLLPHEGEQVQRCVAYWGVKDIAAASATLAAKGIALHEPITEVGGGIKVASFRDADSIIIGLIENPHFPNTCGH